MQNYIIIINIEILILYIFAIIYFKKIWIHTNIVKFFWFIVFYVFPSVLLLFKVENHKSESSLSHSLDDKWKGKMATCVFRYVELHWKLKTRGSANIAKLNTFYPTWASELCECSFFRFYADAQMVAWQEFLTSFKMFWQAPNRGGVWKIS